MLGDERVVTYIPFFVLLVGGVFGGAFISWFICPFVGVLVLPFFLKVLTLVLVLLIGVCSFFLVERGVKWLMGYFMGSMWFLGFISSSPGVRRVFSLGSFYYSQEFSWMELIRGKGALSFFSYVRGSLQKRQNFSFSLYFSLMTFVLIVFFCFI